MIVVVALQLVGRLGDAVLDHRLRLLGFGRRRLGAFRRAGHLDAVEWAYKDVMAGVEGSVEVVLYLLLHDVDDQPHVCHRWLLLGDIFHVRVVKE